MHHLSFTVRAPQSALHMHMNNKIYKKEKWHAPPSICYALQFQQHYLDEKLCLKHLCVITITAMKRRVQFVQHLAMSSEISIQPTLVT